MSGVCVFFFFMDAAGSSVGSPVEVLQHGAVGFLKHPLLGGGGGIARVHEDPPLVRAAVDTAVTDGVIQTFILEKKQEGL